MASQHQQQWKLMTLFFAVFIRLQMRPKYYFDASRIVLKSQSLAEIHTQIANFCKMQFASSSQLGFMSGRLKNGIAYSPRRRRGFHCVR
jgi:hypothetical protein